MDYQVLLLSLADEYLNAAHSQGTTMALSTKQDDVEEYYKLISTGLGCLEAVLKVSNRQSTSNMRPPLTASIELETPASQGSLGETSICPDIIRGNGE